MCVRTGPTMPCFPGPYWTDVSEETQIYHSICTTSLVCCDKCNFLGGDVYVENHTVKCLSTK